MRLLSFGEILWDIFPTRRLIGGAPFNFAAHAATYDSTAGYEWATDYTYCGTLNDVMAESDGAETAIIELV